MRRSDARRSVRVGPPGALSALVVRALAVVSIAGDYRLSAVGPASGVASKPWAGAFQGSKVPPPLRGSTMVSRMTRGDGDTGAHSETPGGASRGTPLSTPARLPQGQSVNPGDGRWLAPAARGLALLALSAGGALYMRDVEWDSDWSVIFLSVAMLGGAQLLKGLVEAVRGEKPPRR